MSDDVSHQWSWDHEKDSNISEWYAMPKEELGKKDSLFNSSIMSGIDDTIAKIGINQSELPDIGLKPKAP